MLIGFLLCPYLINLLDGCQGMSQKEIVPQETPLAFRAQRYARAGPVGGPQPARTLPPRGSITRTDGEVWKGDLAPRLYIMAWIPGKLEPP